MVAFNNDKINTLYTYIHKRKPPRHRDSFVSVAGGLTYCLGREVVGDGKLGGDSGSLNRFRIDRLFPSFG